MIRSGPIGPMDKWGELEEAPLAFSNPLEPLCIAISINSLGKLPAKPSRRWTRIQQYITYQPRKKIQENQIYRRLRDKETKICILCFCWVLLATCVFMPPRMRAVKRREQSRAKYGPIRIEGPKSKPGNNGPSKPRPARSRTPKPSV